MIRNCLVSYIPFATVVVRTNGSDVWAPKEGGIGTAKRRCSLFAYYTVPCRSVQSIEILLDHHSNVFFEVITLKSLGCDFDRFLLHIFRHCSVRYYDFRPFPPHLGQGSVEAGGNTVSRRGRDLLSTFLMIAFSSRPSSSGLTFPFSVEFILILPFRFDKTGPSVHSVLISILGLRGEGGDSLLL